MQAAELEQVAENQYKLLGDVTLYTASSLADAKPFNASVEVTVDLSAVGKTDSGTLVLLVNWQRQAAQQEASISFAGLPQSLRALMNLYDLDTVLQHKYL